MEVLFFYSILGLIFSTLIFFSADHCPWYLFIILCISWMPFILFGAVATIFMDVKQISSKVNI